MAIFNDLWASNLQHLKLTVLRSRADLSTTDSGMYERFSTTVPKFLRLLGSSSFSENFNDTGWSEIRWRDSWEHSCSTVLLYSMVKVFWISAASTTLSFVVHCSGTEPAIRSFGSQLTGNVPLIKSTTSRSAVDFIVVFWMGKWPRARSLLDCRLRIASKFFRRDSLMRHDCRATMGKLSYWPDGRRLEKLAGEYW